MHTLLKDQQYAIVAFNASGDTVSDLQILSSRLKTEALKCGFEMSITSTFNNAGAFYARENIPFSIMEGVLKEISKRSRTSIYISPADDFDGKRILNQPNPAEIIRKEAFLKAIAP
jgi:hypothetical protein